jgi:Bifunctional DNA primase/polymerase, N-terminal
MSAAPTDDFDFFTAGDPDYEEPAPDPAEVDRYKGLRLVKIPARQKRPTDEGWPAGHDHADVRAHVAAGGNFGVVCGDGLAIFDVDDPAMYERLCREHGVDLTGHLTVWTGGGST